MISYTHDIHVSHWSRPVMDRLAGLGDLLTVKGLAPKAQRWSCDEAVLKRRVLGGFETWLYHGYTMVIPWLYHGYTMLSRDCESILTSFRSGESYRHKKKWHFGDWTMLGWWKRRWNLSGPVQPFFAALGSKGIGWGLSQRLTHEFPLGFEDGPEKCSEFQSGLGRMIQKNLGIGWMLFVDGWNPDDLGWKPLEVFTAKFATETNPWIG